MIAKKIKRKPAKHVTRGSSSPRAEALARYIVDASVENERALRQHEDSSYAHDLGVYAANGERVLGVVARNLKSTTVSDQIAEFGALVGSIPRGDDLVDHWVLSWEHGDQPSVAEQEDAFRIFGKCMGTEDCPSITAFHGDTDNPHGHGGIFRFDPATGQTVARPQGGWDIDTAHKAIAVIEAKYPQWKRSPDRLYDVRNGRIIHRGSNADVGDADNPSTWTRPPARSNIAAASSLLKKIDRASLDYEDDTGLQSRKRVAVLEVVPILLAASSWADAHQKLAALGIGLEKSKNNSGLNIVIDGKPVKGSIHDKTAIRPLEKRWGRFAPRGETVVQAAFTPRLMYPNDRMRTRYHAQKRVFQASLTEMIAQVRASYNGYKSPLPSKEFDPVKMSRHALPSFEDWLAGSVFPQVESILTLSPGISGFESRAGESVPFDLPGFRHEVRAKGVAYLALHDFYAPPAVFDTGKRVYVNDDSDASIILALRLAAARNGGKPVRPFGPPEFLARAEAMATAENIAVVSRVGNKAAGLTRIVPAASPPKAASTMNEPAPQLQTGSAPSQQMAAKPFAERPDWAPTTGFTSPAVATSATVTAPASAPSTEAVLPREKPPQSEKPKPIKGAGLTHEHAKLLAAQRNQGMGR